MFTGIIESPGIIDNITRERGNIHFDITSAISDQLKIDQSVAHDGVCLTVVSQQNSMHRVTAISETLSKSTLANWQKGSEVNLERCLKANGRFDGHIVQGHVDTIATCTEVIEEDGSWRFYFSHESTPELITVPKGSITINGVSLTVVDSSEKTFSVAVIPYTYDHTNFKALKKGDTVNLEFDILGKYVAEMLKRRSTDQ
ncbi:MAG: riboflavin synthase [Bacteroidetes bacterium]|jgi:riboflavin synthase|nr:riboflavin synthase [Bacteroidota bacterium]